jgi:hypothetical protein
LGVLSPAAIFGAAPEVQQTQQAMALVKDVELSLGGTMSGQIVDQQGNKLSGIEVALLQDGRQVAQTKTNKAGDFAVEGLQGGTYQIASINGVTAYRAWSSETAPPAATEGVLLVVPQSVVRAQCQSGCGNNVYGQPMYGQPVYGQPVYGQPVYGQPVQGQIVQGQAVQGQAAQGQVVQGQVVQGQVVQGQPMPAGEVAYGEPAYCGEPVYGGEGYGAAPPVGGRRGWGFLANPWVVGAAVAAAIAIPLALDDNDDAS